MSKLTISNGFIYFAKNITGYKLGFTKIKLSDAIKNLNTSHISEDFTLVNAINVNYPKKIKNQISKRLVDKKINKDLYDITHKDVSAILLDIEMNTNVRNELSIFSNQYNKENLSNNKKDIYLNNLNNFNNDILLERLLLGVNLVYKN